jgi:hypothetical protein
MFLVAMIFFLELHQVRIWHLDEMHTEKDQFGVSSTFQVVYKNVSNAAPKSATNIHQAATLTTTLSNQNKQDKEIALSPAIIASGDLQISSRSLEMQQSINTSLVDVISSPTGFVDEPEELCTELLERSKDTEEGHEPWRAFGGLLWTCSDCGQEGSTELGNHLSRWYVTRAIASAAGVTIQLDCRSPVTDLIPQYLHPTQTVLDDRASFSWKQACQSDLIWYPHESHRNGLEHVVSAIRLDLSNMTQGILSKTPWLLDDLDEAVVHLRTGDIGRLNVSKYGLVPFHVYTNLIPDNTRTIGLVTAPYRQNRPGAGYGDAELSEAVTEAARDYIQRKFPDARVSIRNDDVSETMAITYVRMVAAKWLFCGSSTFCLFPALATSGESYILQSPLYGGYRSWINKVAESFENVHYKKGEIIFSSESRNWKITRIIRRLRRGSDHHKT